MKIKAPFEVASKWAGYKGQWILLSLRGAKRFVENWNVRLAFRLKQIAWEDGLCKNPDMDEIADNLLSELRLPVANLPTGCDLSLSSLQWAIETGTENDFGRPNTLLIGPENLKITRYLPTIPWRIIALPYNTWRVQFERGIVESKGPQ